MSLIVVPLQVAVPFMPLSLLITTIAPPAHQNPLQGQSNSIRIGPLCSNSRAIFPALQVPSRTLLYLLIWNLKQPLQALAKQQTDTWMLMVTMLVQSYTLPMLIEPQIPSMSLLHTSAQRACPVLKQSGFLTIYCMLICSTPRQYWPTQRLQSLIEPSQSRALVVNFT